MDSRDLSSVAAAVSREGQSVDEDGMLSLTYALAKDAAVYFQGHKYAECLQILKQLLLKKPGDPKVLHNIAVAEYFRDGCSDFKKLLNELCNVKKQIEDLARMAEDSSETRNNTGNKLGSISKESNTLMPGSQDSNVYTGEFDTSVVSLNIAVV
uniref:CCR4-NOT transcription complex subunit 10 n=1 Tax=Kalanchoe fedtschenkoi TaxID=63787 RepID=A0A7N0VHK3_KALFE